MKQIVTLFIALTAILLFLFAYVYFTNTASNEVVAPYTQIQATITPSPGIPIRIIIPAIQVDAGIEQLGVTPDGEMEVPTTIADTGWFNPGSRPGNMGSAVIAGHFNGETGEQGVFAHLDTLKKGDEIFIRDDAGISRTFIVRETRLYNPGYADEVFSKNDTAHVNLVTCTGFWNTDKKSYSKRFVVFADITQ